MIYEILNKINEIKFFIRVDFRIATTFTTSKWYLLSVEIVLFIIFLRAKINFRSSIKIFINDQTHRKNEIHLVTNESRKS